jgi:hypothetical protein
MPVPATGLRGVQLREAVADLRATIDLVRAAIDKRLNSGLPGDMRIWVNLEAVYPDNAVIEREGRYFSFPYSVGADNQVALGDPVVVDKAFQPATLREAVFLEAVGEADSGKWLIRVMRAGLSANGNFYPDAVLREAAPLFDGARVFIKSDAEHVKGGGKDVRNLVGGLSAIKFVEGGGPDLGEIQALLTLIEPSGDVAVKLREASARGLAGLFGFSIDADGTAKTQLREGRKARVAQSITRVNSVDLIVEPAAGGELIRMVESINPQEDRDMSLRQKMLDTIKAKAPGAYAKLNPETASDDDLEVAYREAVSVNDRGADGGASPGVAQAQGGLGGSPSAIEERIRMVEARADMRATVAGCNLPDAAKDRIRADFERRERFVEADVAAAIEAERTYLAKFTESGKVELGDFGAGARAEDRSAKMAGMLDAFFDPAHKDHRSVISFKECYVEYTGDRMVTGHVRDCDRAKLRESAGASFREALDTTAWAQALGDAVTRRLQAIYAGMTDLQVWRKVVGIARPTDFRTQHLVRIGGYGNLPTVNQGAAYAALTSPGDDEATYAVTKRGGLETVTLEMIKNDDVRSISRIPQELALAAANTLYEFVFDFFRTNPTCTYDSVALYHASHANLFTAALSATEYETHRQAMVKQTRNGSAKRLGVSPAFLLVPFELEKTAFDLFHRDTNLDETFVQSQKPQVIVPAYWTDANDWCTVADPSRLPGIEIGFLDGKEDPELFMQNSPTVGSLFSNDQITYKIRHIYGGTVDVDGHKATTKAVVP